MKFFECKTCGNIVELVKESGVPVVCCGQKMEEIIPGSVDAAVEKHVPVVTVTGNKVKAVVGEVEHPMIEEHFIGWIAIETEQGVQRKTLSPGEKPELEFALTEGDKLIATYAWCNIHGLWKK